MSVLGSGSPAIGRPHFLVIGAPKCGTSTLHYLLGQHPDVLMSEPKETHFFDRHYDKGLDAYWRDHFARWAGQRAVGEATPKYLRLPFVARRIRRDLPEAKLIVSLRHPVDRAHSAWWMRYSRAREHRSFEVALAEELVHVRAGAASDGPDGEGLWRADELLQARHKVALNGYLTGGHYAEQLRVYLDLFPRESLKIILFDDLVADPQAVARDLWAFLGVDPSAPLADRTPRNAAYGKWTATIYRLPCFHRIAPRLPRGFWRTVRGWLDRTSPRPPLDPRTRRMLVEYYADHRRALEDLIGRDLSRWNA